jgi:hypothetical protein
MGEVRNVYGPLIGKPKGKRLHGRPRRRWEDIIVMDLKEIGWEIMKGIHLAEDRGQW